MKYFTRYLLLVALTICIFSCAKQRPVKLPPVEEGWKKTSAMKSGYRVQKGDTLYSIAWAFGLDYRDLAVGNNLESPYTLRCGQKLRITSLPKSRKTQRTNYPKKKPAIAKSLKGWVWPTEGKVIAGFTNKLGGNRGIDIKGVYGQKIRASNGGEVVYSGTGLRSYGKLIIIKHSDDYLSAYAYNQHMLVKEGGKVKKGQSIATMGQDNNRRVCLHFEIRRFGKPVNPLKYLPKK